MTDSAMAEFHPPVRVLLGPGPSTVHPRVLQTMTTPILGYLDPDFFQLMDSVQELLRRVFQTRNRVTFPISGTGSAGMEASLYNLLEPGDTVLIGMNGFFGERMLEMATRCGATPVPLTAEWGRIVEPETVREALRKHKHVRAVALVHGETSTGILQPLEEISRLAHEHNALLIVDAVTSLAGVPLPVDSLGVDACYSGTQKCLSCPPGLAPVTFNETALKVIQNRSSKVRSWYLDVSLVEKYWVSGRVYHHTPPVSMLYGLREALRIVLEEGLEQRFARHQRNAEALRRGLEAMGLTLLAQKEHRLNPLTSVLIPDGVDDMAVRTTLLKEFNIEIGGGLGPYRGKLWRIGLMGYSSSESNVVLVLHALERVLSRHGFEVPRGAGVSAAQEVWAKS